MATRTDEDIRSLAEFQEGPAPFLNQLRDTRRTIVLTEQDRSIAVLMDAGEYADLNERLELLEAICRAETQLGRGQGIAHHDARARVLASLER